MSYLRKRILNRSNTGAGAIIILSLFLLVLLTGIAIVVQMNKAKNVERAVSVEYNLKTYYTAYAGVMECIATRMAPRSNLLLKKKNVSIDYLDKFNRLDNSGYIYSDPYSAKKKDIIGSYSYASYILSKDNNGKYTLDDSNLGGKDERFLVYSRGETILPDGTEDVVYIKAIFDLNRFDDDLFNADEMEVFDVLPASSPEAKYASTLMKKTSADSTPPLVKKVSVTSLNGEEVTKEINDVTEKLEINNVGVRSKISLVFTEPIDANFIDDIVLKKVMLKEKPVKNLEKVVISPKNLEVFILPSEKTDGRILDYDSQYKLSISGIVDYNGNQLSEGPEVILNTEKVSLSGIDSTQEGVVDSTAVDSSSGDVVKDPFGTGVKNSNTGDGSGENLTSGTISNTSSSVNQVDRTGFVAPSVENLSGGVKN